MSYRDIVREWEESSSPIRIASLPDFTGLTVEELADFIPGWQRLNAARKRRVLEDMIALAEDNVELDFDAIFLISLEDEDPGVRLLAIGGLWEYEQRDLAAKLIALLERDPDMAVRAEAALALGKFVLLAEMGSLPRRHAAMVEAALRNVLEHGQEPEPVLARALESAAINSSAAWVRQRMTEAYESDSHRLRISAIHAMGCSCDERWLPLLHRELGSDDSEARFEAALACGAIGERASVPYLAPLAQDDDAEVRSAAISSLGEIGGPQARETLAALLDADDQPEDIREAAREALMEVNFEDDPLAFPLETDD